MNAAAVFVVRLGKRFAAVAALGLGTLALAGCIFGPQRSTQLAAPWAGEASRTLAVAPLLNESGSGNVDGVRLADRLTERLNGVEGVGTLPVNRVLAEMQRLGLSEVRSESSARALRDALRVDGLVAGTVTDFDPYDPPKIGLNLGVFYAPGVALTQADREAAARLSSEPDRWAVAAGAPDLRALSRSATPSRIESSPDSNGRGRIAAVSRFYNAADPATQDALARFVRDRGVDYARTDTDTRLYRISSDLFADFVAREAAADLMFASRP